MDNEFRCIKGTRIRESFHFYVYLLLYELILFHSFFKINLLYPIKILKSYIITWMFYSKVLEKNKNLGGILHSFYYYFFFIIKRRHQTVLHQEIFAYGLPSLSSNDNFFI